MALILRLVSEHALHAVFSQPNSTSCIMHGIWPSSASHNAFLPQGAMPPAQGLVMMTQLHEGTRLLAPRLAALLIRLYVASIIPLALWSALFVARLGQPLAALL